MSIQIHLTSLSKFNRFGFNTFKNPSVLLLVFWELCARIPRIASPPYWIRVWKGIFGIRHLTKIRCGILKNAQCLDGNQDLTAPREEGFAKIWTGNAGFFAQVNVLAAKAGLEVCFVVWANKLKCNFFDRWKTWSLLHACMCVNL